MDMETLCQLKNLQLSKIDKENLIELTDIKIDTSLPVEERINQYLEEIKNPYYHLCDGHIVKINYKETMPLYYHLKNHFMGLKKR